MDDLLPFLLAALALTASPGPANVSLAAMGAAFGARRSLAYQAGSVAGMIVIMAATASGLAALLLAVPGVREAAVVLGLAYILWLAWRIAAAPPRAAVVVPAEPPTALGGLLMQLANPKAYAAVAALFAGFTLADDPLADALTKSVVLLGPILFATTLWVHLGALLARLVTRPRTQRRVSLCFALLLVVSTAVPFL
jgi:threonine/homoserine/homoserine lactone efflux protein